MENLLSTNPLVLLFLWIILGVLGEPVKKLVGEIDDSVDNWFGFIIKALQNMNQGAGQAASSGQQTLEAGARKVADEIFQEVINAVEQAASVLGSGASSISGQLGTPLAQRLIGALAYMIGTILFIYADVVQAVNNVTALIGTFRPPSIFEDLFPSLLISGAGSALMLGVILFDFLGLTNFAPWNKLQDKRLRWLFVVLVVLTTVAAMSFSTLLGIVRFHLTSPFPPEVAKQIIMWASLAQWLILVPMLIATLLLGWWGLMGLLVMGMIPVVTGIILLQLLKLLLRIVKIALPMGGKVTGIVFNILFMLLGMIPGLLGMFFGFTSMSVEILLKVLTGTLGILVFPFEKFGNWATRLDWVQKNLNIKPPKKP